MANTNRYKGLLFLRKALLPVPAFIKISNINDIKKDWEFDVVPFGWTIRTCKVNGINEFNLFYKNNISFKELKIILSERLQKHTDEFYIIYPSWDFDFSFNIIKERNEYIVEGDIGSQKEISLGSRMPKFSLIINSSTLTVQQSFLSYPSKNILDGIFRVLKLLKNNVIKERYYTEVVFTKQNQIFFYEFTDLSFL
ncbi:MAG TPA: hypothetical protein PLW77_03740 [Bacteroidales bacterium]|nr:hypothetical protein [Bacteroidales bacterium]HQB21371.1 hypothetical protein [Bacteroidales bacterium]